MPPIGCSWMQIVDPARLRRIESDVARLRAGDYEGSVERINLERDLVGALVGGCRKTVARLHRQAGIFQCRVLGWH